MEDGGVDQLLLVQEDVRIFQLDGHGVLVGDEVGREVAAVELHTFDHFQFVFEAATFVNGDDAFFTDFFHRFGDDFANALVAVGRDRAYLRNGLGVGAGHGHRLNLFDRCGHGLVDTAFQIHRVHARGHAFQAFRYDGLCQNGGRGGTVTGGVGSLGSDFFHHLGTHVLELVFQFDLFGNRYTIFGHSRCAKRLVQHYVAAFRAQRNFYGVCQNVDAARHAFTSIIRKLNLLSCHVRYFLNIEIEK